MDEKVLFYDSSTLNYLLHQYLNPFIIFFYFLGMVQKIGLDKSSPYKNGGFLPLFNILF